MRIISSYVDEFGYHIDRTIEWGTTKGLIAFEASNGSGKTFLAEAAFAVLWGDFPSYKGNIYDAVRQNGSGKATIEVVFELEGKTYRATRKVNVTTKTRKQDAWIGIDGKTPLAGPKIRDFDLFVLNLLGSQKIAAATWFSSYRSQGDICELPPAGRSDLIAEFISTAHLGSIGSRAKSERLRAATEIGVHEQRIRDHRDALEPPEALASAESALAQTKEDITRGKKADVDIIADMARMTERVEKARAAENHRRSLAERVEQKEKLEHEVAQLETMITDQSGLKTALETAEETKVSYDRLREAIKYRSETLTLKQRADDAQNAIAASVERRRIAATAAADAFSLHSKEDPFGDVHDAEIGKLAEYEREVGKIGEIRAAIEKITHAEETVVSSRPLLTAMEEAIAKMEEKQPEVFDFETILREHDELAVLQKKTRAALDHLENERMETSRKISDAATVRALWTQSRELIEKDAVSVAKLSVRREHLAILEQAFGRSGVQALLIEHAIKPFEEMASKMMQAATEGAHDVRIETLKENLDGTFSEQVSILIADRAGERDIYQYSGGERRILSTIIRLAFARWIAQRSGKRCGTILIDEAFDSLDPEHVDILIEMCDNVTEHFENIILVTPNPAYASRVPNRITV